MKLALRAVPAISSREEVFFTRARRRRGTHSDAEFQILRVPKVPPLSPEGQAFVALRKELELSERTAASAIGIRKLDVFQALERGELAPVDPSDWKRAEQAIRDAHAREATEPARWW